MIGEIFKHILDNLVLADLWEEIIKRILDAIKEGADFWILLFVLAAGYICWLWIGTAKDQLPVLRRRLGAGAILAVLAGFAIWVNHAIFQRERVFSKNLTGILVMRLAGDDALNSLQNELVDKLNVELQKDPAAKQIEVHAGHKMVDKSDGLNVGHELARTIGQPLNAKLVIWGQKIGDKKFYPCITVINAPKTWGATSERTDDVQKIGELRLPDELVDEPLYLIDFTAGYSYYDQGNYKEALPYFEAALRRHGGTPDEIADLQFFSGFCNQALGTGQKDMTSKFQKAIAYFEKAAEAYKVKYPKKWAETQNNLGCVYFVLPGDHAANLQKAIDAFQAALGVGPDKVLPVDRAMTQNNLGNAYAAAPTDRAANLQRAIDAFQAALGVRTEKGFPVDWAMTQFNLGVAYADLPTGDRAANLQSAKACFKAALTKFTETTFPNDYRNAATELVQVELQVRNLAPK